MDIRLSAVMGLVCPASCRQRSELDLLSGRAGGNKDCRRPSSRQQWDLERGAEVLCRVSNFTKKKKQHCDNDSGMLSFSDIRLGLDFFALQNL